MRIAGIGVVGLVLAGCQGNTDQQVADLQQQMAALQQQVQALQDQVGTGTVVTTSDLDGYATEQWVQDQGYVRDSDLQTAVSDALATERVATQEWVTSNFATPGDVSAAIGAALPAGDLATQTWVDQHYMDSTEVGTAIYAALPSGTLATQEWATSQFATPAYVTTAITSALPSGTLATQSSVSSAIAAALPSGTLATQEWTEGHYVGKDDIGSGLTIDTAGTVALDTDAVDARVQAIAFTSIQDLRNALDDVYVPQSGGLSGDLLLNAAVQVGSAQTTCTQGTGVGTVQYVDGQFLGCTPDGWLILGAGKNGSSPLVPGDSCLQIKNDFPSSPSGTYWLQDSTGAAYDAYCDMTTDGGGWTLVATISGADGNHWNTQFGYWSDTNALGSADAPWLDFKPPAFWDLDVSSSEVLYQRRYDGVVRAKVILDNACLFGQSHFRDLFTTDDTSLFCAKSHLYLVQPPADATGVASSDYAEGALYGMTGSSTAGWCWNGGDNDTNTWRGRGYYTNSGSSSCVQYSHTGGFAVWTHTTSQFTDADITGVNWLNGTDYTKTDISFFVR